MSAFSSNRPSIRLKAIPRIPAKLKATGGLKFEKSGDVWTITPDFSALNLVTNFPDVANNQVWLFNPVTGVYVRSTMQTILDALSIATAPDLEAAIAAAQAAQAGAESARDDTQNIADQAQTDISNAEASAVAAVGAAQTTAENSLNAILAAADVMIVYDHAPLNTEGEDGWFALDTSETRVGVYGPKTAGVWGARRGYVIGLDGTGTVNGPVSSVAHHLAGFANTSGGLLEDSGVAVSTDTTLASNSDAKLPTEKAVKAYVDGIVAAQDAMVFKGVQDCSANPNYPAANRGDTYRVSVAGKIGGASGIVVEVGDIFICLDDSTSAGNQATVGSHWTILQTNIDGAVVGPASVTDGRLVLFDGTTGKVIKQHTGAPGALAVLNTVGTSQIDNNAVTLAKLVAATTTKVLVGRNTASGGTFEEVTLSQLLDWVGSAADGDILMRSGGAWTRLAKGTNGQFLTLSGGLPAWASGGGGQPIPTSSADFQVGSVLIAKLASGTVANGSTVGGSSLNLVVGGAGTLTTGGVSLSGTWKNISGMTMDSAGTCHGYWVRTA